MSPTIAEQLTAQSSDEQYRTAVSECIRQLTGEGRDSAQAQAICYSQAETATGRPYPRVAEGSPEISPEITPGIAARRQTRRKGRKATFQGITDVF